MSSQLATFWRQQLQLSDAHVAQLEQQMRDLETQRQGTTPADLANARELLDAISGRVGDLQEDYEREKARSKKLRTLHWRQYMREFPPEVLCHIFLDVDEPGGRPPSLSDCSRCLERAKAPFVLAAVCRSWRGIALDMRNLWTYICIPVRQGVIEDQSRDLAALLIARSKEAPLDIVLPWRSARHPYIIWDMDTSAPAAQILVLLAKASRRWRSIEMSIAEGALTVPAMGLFRTVTPWLEHCAIQGWTAGQGMRWVPDSLNFFPVAPKLRSFSSAYTNIIPTTRGGPYHSLTELILHVKMSCAAVWAVLRCAGPRLELLELELERDPPDSEYVIPQPIAFPLLRSLKVHWRASVLFRTNGTRISMPALRALEMHAVEPADLRQWWQHTPLNIEELTIDGGGTLDGNDAGELLALLRLRELIVSHCIMSTPFLNALAVPRPDGHWICPRLESLIISNGSIVEDQDGESFVRVFQARKDAHRANRQHAPRALRNLDLGWESVPGWAADQVRYILDADA
ncbi:hypothetical protein AURDEDRAFT_179740 [Auricularia subglabra TFB-10046 SS5]|nr:hypothetical protein AURDEDRAFT_179740 [Auricularia subglabra TFB-10046 SS5]